MGVNRILSRGRVKLNQKLSLKCSYRAEKVYAIKGFCCLLNHNYFKVCGVGGGGKGLELIVTPCPTEVIISYYRIILSSIDIKIKNHKINTDFAFSLVYVLLKVSLG